MVQLFSGLDLSTLLDSRTGEAVDWLKARPEQDVLDDAPGLGQEAVDRFAYDTVSLALYDVEISRPTEETGDHGLYWSTIVHVPYTGGIRTMFFLRPRTHSWGVNLLGDESGQEVKLEVHTLPQVELKGEVQKTLERLETVVGYLNADIDEWRKALPALLRAEVDTRSKSIKVRHAAAASVGYQIRD